MSYFANYEQNSPSKLQQAAVGIAVAVQWRHLLPMGSCNQFCLILHPHRIPFPFSPTVASPGGTALFKSMTEQLC